MDYQFLTPDERDDMLVSLMKSTETDHYMHEINLERYEAMLQTLPDGAFKTKIAKDRTDTVDRLVAVNSIIAATIPQMPSQERVAASVLRLETAKAAAPIS